MRAILFCLSLALCTSPVLVTPARAQDGPIGLAAADPVVQSGLLQHILPRFSLKTGVRVVQDAAGPMALNATPGGTAVFQGGGVTYYLHSDSSPRQVRFRKWMQSDIGKRTIDSFQPDGAQPFSASVVVAETEGGPLFTGDTDLGAELAQTHCGRCHVVTPENRMNGLGSTPSFAVLRALPDWGDRFQQFYVLRPHGAFTQVKDVTAPFDPMRPPPIVPVQITLGDLDAILAFVAITEAADLGAALQFQ